ncbi:hypothetical protein [Pseudovibrio sp. Tun.PSC04-5.I4]|uniref:hypothetical protein n=1 Tax=Pseudovibrio sp. Tun.PSC04-5.I4 TaxID=1798213 RepID=UPI000B8043C1|nr:hypothetical protein [Pseudovibrio sp. Tun.PSC04-5.I4]
MDLKLLTKLKALILSCKPSSLLAYLVAIVFVILQLIAPPGMMPRASEDGFEITICTSQGLQKFFITTSDEQEQGTEKTNTQFCAFSFASFMFPEAVIPGNFVVEAHISQLSFFQNIAVNYNFRRKSHTPRAPPFFV